MSAKLSNDDCCAVDLILEHAPPGVNGTSPCFASAPSAVLQERLSRVEKLLGTIGQHKAEEPAADLVSRTLDFCDQRTAHRIASHGKAATTPAIATIQ